MGKYASIGRCGQHLSVLDKAGIWDESTPYLPPSPAPGFSGLAPAPARRVVGLGKDATDADGVQDSGAVAPIGNPLLQKKAPRTRRGACIRALGTQMAPAVFLWSFNPGLNDGRVVGIVVFPGDHLPDQLQRTVVAAPTERDALDL